MLRFVKVGYSKYTMNFKVLCVLIESGFIQKLCRTQDNRSMYPNLLSCILQNSDRNFVKESCCRMIIKYFGPNGFDDVEEENDDVNNEKIEYINMIESLMQIAQRQNDYGLKLTSLAIMALVNMCSYDVEV